MTDLERALAELGDHLDHPAGDHLPHRVAAAVSAVSHQRHHDRRRVRRLIAAGIVAALGVGGAVASPAIGDWLGLRGVRVRQEPAPGPAAPFGDAMDLGRRTTLAEAGRRAGFEVPVPAALGAPDEAWVRTAGDASIVSLVWAAGPGLPAVGQTGVGALLTVTDGGGDGEAVVEKFAGGATQVEEVTVDGGRGLWIDGIHEVTFAAPDGRIRTDRLRLADRVLLWERGPLTLRLEAALDLDGALAVAATVH